MAYRSAFPALAIVITACAGGGASPSGDTGGGGSYNTPPDTYGPTRAKLLAEWVPQVCPTYAKLACEADMACNLQPPKDAMTRCQAAVSARCRQTLENRLLGVTAAKPIALDPQNLASCFSGWAKDNCSEPPSVIWSTYCSQVFHGSVTAGGDCNGEAEVCIPPLGCVNGSTCGDRKTSSESCMDDSACATGTVCTPVMNGHVATFCAPVLGSPGDPCGARTVCLDGACNTSSRCQTYSGVGGPCDPTHECMTYMSVTVGQECYSTLAGCAPGLTCLSSGTCIMGIAEGLDCGYDSTGPGTTPCAPGLFCDEFSPWNLCVPHPTTIGATCYSSCVKPLECVTDGTDAGTCQMLPGPGEPCAASNDAPCLASYCVGGTCQEWDAVETEGVPWFATDSALFAVPQR